MAYISNAADDGHKPVSNAEWIWPLAIVLMAFLVFCPYVGRKELTMYFNEALSMLPLFLVVATILTLVVAVIGGIHSLVFPPRNKYGRNHFRHHTAWENNKTAISNRERAGQRVSAAYKEDKLR